MAKAGYKEMGTAASVNGDIEPWIYCCVSLYLFTILNLGIVSCGSEAAEPCKENLTKEAGQDSVSQLS